MIKCLMPNEPERKEVVLTQIEVSWLGIDSMSPGQLSAYWLNYGQDNQKWGLRSPQRPDRLWSIWTTIGVHSLDLNWPQTRPRLVIRFAVRGVIPPIPYLLHGVLLNKAQRLYFHRNVSGETEEKYETCQHMWSAEWMLVPRTRTYTAGIPINPLLSRPLMEEN